MILLFLKYTQLHTNLQHISIRTYQIKKMVTIKPIPGKTIDHYHRSSSHSCIIRRLIRHNIERGSTCSCWLWSYECINNNNYKILNVTNIIYHHKVQLQTVSAVAVVVVVAVACVGSQIAIFDLSNKKQKQSRQQTTTHI